MIMARIRWVLLSVLATFSMNAVASTSAWAHAYFDEGVEVTKESPNGVAIEGTGGTSKIVGSGLLKIECTKDALAGELERKGESSGTLKLTGCKVFNNSNVEEPRCAVTEPVTLAYVGHLTVFKEAIGNLLEPGSGITFVKIFLTGSECSFKGEYDLNGKQQCAFGSAYENEATQHEMKCEPVGSELKLGTLTAELTSTVVIKLVSGGKWSIKK